MDKRETISQVLYLYIGHRCLVTDSGESFYKEGVHDITGSLVEDYDNMGFELLPILKPFTEDSIGSLRDGQDVFDLHIQGCCIYEHELPENLVKIKEKSKQ